MRWWQAGSFTDLNCFFESFVYEPGKHKIEDEFRKGREMSDCQN